MFVFAGVLVTVACAQPPLADPEPFLLPPSALPAYEQDIDHAGLIRAWNEASRRRGEQVYQRACHSCHGDANLRGSLPDALAFAHGKFQRAADPFGMYQTLTRGWRMMPPQPQLVPREKYDVIHYIRETFLAPPNAPERFAITDAYLGRLPRGATQGPAASLREPWREMDYGRFLIGTFEVADAADRALAAAQPRAVSDAVAPAANIAQKGIALRLDAGGGGIAAGSAWVVFEHDTLRVAGAWTGAGFIDWEGINFNTRHVVRPRTVGELQFETADGAGWANPETGRFDDARLLGLDGRRFGPFPRRWMHYRGLYRHGDRVVVSYRVGGTAVLESHDLQWRQETPVFVRTLNLARSSHDLLLRVANAAAAVAVAGADPAWLRPVDGFVTLAIPAGATPLNLTVRVAKTGTAELERMAASAPAARDLSAFTAGGPPQWREKVVTPVVESEADGPFAWARITLPYGNVWRSRMRLSGLDFLPGGDAAVLCTWDGDVWRADGITSKRDAITWRRIASGLFQPLGIKVRDGEIFVSCRDQLVVLRDLNGDGETDYYESFNSDHQVTEHFHEFAMGLQTDRNGNFYYAKSARHARTSLVPQHGTLLKVSHDGTATEILARGFRAANGVCVNSDGTFFVTDQEGHWMPANRINRVQPGAFYGNMWSYGAPADASDAAMEPPVCWIDKGFDRSPSELLWVDAGEWGGLRGALLNLSYGRGRIEIVLHEQAGGRWQGAVCALPVPDFPTGVMRGRIHPQSGELYVCGLSAWGSAQTQQEGGLYRLRWTGQPAMLPVGWHVRPDGVELTFSEPLPPRIAAEPARFGIRAWGLKRSENYGSPRIAETAWAVSQVDVLPDARKIRLTIPQLRPTDAIEITCHLVDARGRQMTRVINGTIHHVPGRR